MSVDVFSAILSYATIPIYVAGLLFLVYIIAHSQLGFSLSNQVKQSVKTELAQERPKAPISNYLVVVVLFALFTFLTIADQRRQKL
jgi:L-asparagine transporter-like permease